MELREPDAVERDDVEGIFVEPLASLLFPILARSFAAAGGFGTGCEHGERGRSRRSLLRESGQLAQVVSA